MPNRKVIISYTGNTIVSLEFLTKYTGTLVSLNSYGNLIGLQLNGGTIIYMPYNTAFVDIAGTTTTPTFNDLKIGSTLTLQLNEKQEQVSMIPFIQTSSTRSYRLILLKQASSKGCPS